MTKEDSKPISIPRRNLKKNEYGITVYDDIVTRYIEKQRKLGLIK